MPPWTHGPFVIVNGCETLKLSPTGAAQLLAVLRELGAAAVIAPEVEMYPPSAAAIGERLITGLLQAREPAELMVAIRRELLRELNPMALAYTVYALPGVAWEQNQIRIHRLRATDYQGAWGELRAQTGPVSPVPATGTPALAPTGVTEQVRQLVECGGTMYAVGSFTQISHAE